MQEIDIVSYFPFIGQKKNIPYHPKYMYIWGDDILNIEHIFNLCSFFPPKTIPSMMLPS